MQSNEYLAQLNAAANTIFAPARGAAPNGGAGLSPEVLQFHMQVQGLVSEMQYKLADGEREMAILGEKLTAQADTIEELRGNNAQLVTQITEAQQQVVLAGADYTKKLAEKEAEMLPLTSKSAQLEAEVNELKGKIKELEDALAAAETERDALKKTAGKSAEEKLGLTGGGVTSEKGIAEAATESLTTDEAAAKIAEATGRTVNSDAAALRAEFFEKKAYADTYGGQHYREFEAWYQANSAKILAALNGA